MPPFLFQVASLQILSVWNAVEWSGREHALSKHVKFFNYSHQIHVIWNDFVIFFLNSHTSFQQRFWSLYLTVVYVYVFSLWKYKEESNFKRTREWISKVIILQCLYSSFYLLDVYAYKLLRNSYWIISSALLSLPDGFSLIVVFQTMIPSLSIIPNYGLFQAVAN